MCGIVGILSPNPSQDELQRINDLLIHRGPGDSGINLREGIGMAARRLSIIDLDSGHQPTSNENQRLWLVCNGEIVNAPQLRKELENSGHHFRTGTDFEVIVHAYEQWGDEFVNQLQDMFTIALWDVESNVLLLARDRFGIKPLYYSSANSEFAFASEIRLVLKALPGLPRLTNLEAIWRLFEINFIPAPLTPFQAVRALLPAHILQYEEGKITLRAYCQPVFPRVGEHVQVDPSHAAEEFITQLSHTLDAWRMNNFPVDSLLIRGIDSASVVALLTEISNDPMQTLNVGFDFKSRDESAQAREIAHFLGSQHHEIHFSLTDFDSLPQAVRHLEYPQLSTVSLYLFRFYQACHKAGFKVIMNSEGVDELLGGYPWYQQDQRVYPYTKWPRPFRCLLSRIPSLVYQDKRQGLALGMSDPIDRYLLWRRETYVGQPTNLLMMDSFTPMAEIWREGFSPLLEGLHPFDQFSLLESRTRLPDWINLQGDRMSMVHSVESRPAFLDHLLWENVAKLPPGLKLSPKGNKYLLRLGMKGRLPPNVLARPKRDLSSPVNTRWRAEKSPEWIEKYLEPSILKDTDYFNSQEVNRLPTIHKSRQANLSDLLTGVLTTKILHHEVMKVYQSTRKG